MNKATLRKELMELTPAERIDLAVELWESIPPDEFPALTDEQKEEIDRRWAEHQKNPERASPWEEVRARLWARYK
jgi:putative addiction module component (TIGR02574 family)